MINKIKNEDKPNFKRRKHKKINPKEGPSADEIKKAVDEYLENGGRITKVEPLYLDDFDYTFS